MSVSSGEFYSQYYGHPLSLLGPVLTSLRSQRPTHRCLFLMGDSSLDNKHWFFSPSQDKPLQMRGDKWFTAPACNGYENVLDGRMVQDVSYHFNAIAAQRKLDIFSLNCAEEESTIQNRFPNLSRHDEFIKDHVTDRDIIVLSVGGNDIALAPSISTMLSLGWISFFSWTSSINKGSAWGMRHVTRLFRNKVENILMRVTSKTKPMAIVVCMVYFPCEHGSGWSDWLLAKMGYDSHPERLQTVMRTVFRDATSKIRVEGVPVYPCALYDLLDSKDLNDYVERVEPSVQGGRKMAAGILDLLQSRAGIGSL